MFKCGHGSRYDIDYYGLCARAEVEDFFKRMDRDYDGRLSFGEFMGEETPLEKVLIVEPDFEGGIWNWNNTKAKYL